MSNQRPEDLAETEQWEQLKKRTRPQGVTGVGPYSWQSLKRDGLTMTASYLGCFMGLMPWLIAACWVVYSIQVADWRFAAIALLPNVASILIGLTRAKRKPETA